MPVHELRNRDEARLFLAQGLWLHRAVAPGPGTVRQSLQWALEIVAGGQPMPPVGFVGDLGFVALALDRDGKPKGDAVVVPGWTRELAPRYEDYVLGKLYSDWSFERAGDALRRYAGEERDRDRSRGLAYLVRQFRDRASLSGVDLPPGLIRGLIEEKPEDLLSQAWESLQADGPLPLLRELYEELVAAARRMAEALALEDVVALEQRTALADMGQYVAHRQILQTAVRLEDAMPRRKVKPLAGRQEVPTRVLDEDTYPVGGFSSISTRGSVESILHSQLAFMEPSTSTEPRPDMFDIKFVRDELYYYSRDENQFLRRRRVFLFALPPELTQTRFKDPQLPVQRGVMLMGLLIAAVRRLTDWLSTDALVFEFLFTTEGDQATPLVHEQELVRMLLREQIENGTVVVQTMRQDALPAYCRQRASRSQCHLLLASVSPMTIRAELTMVEYLRVRSAAPELSVQDRPPLDLEAEEPAEAWARALEVLLAMWV